MLGDSSTAPPRVLIVDDDGATADSFSRTLRLEGFEVWAALSAEEGLDLAQTHQPHAIVLDLRMPLTSGLQFLRAIRAVPEGKVDATFAAIGIGINEEANAMEPIRFLSLPPGEASNKILAKYGGSIVKQDPITGIRGDTDVIGYPLHLASSTKVSDRTVATLLKAWWDHHAELQTIHPQFKKWTKNVQAITNFTVPYHTGAVKFYREAGVWTAKHDARTKEICG